MLFTHRNAPAAVFSVSPRVLARPARSASGLPQMKFLSFIATCFGVGKFFVALQELKTKEMRVKDRSAG